MKKRLYTRAFDYHTEILGKYQKDSELWHHLSEDAIAEAEMMQKGGWVVESNLIEMEDLRTYFMVNLSQEY